MSLLYLSHAAGSPTADDGPQLPHGASLTEFVGGVNEANNLESAITIAQLAIVDLDMILDISKVKGTGTRKDEEYVIETLCKSLSQWISSAQDIILKRSVGSTMTADAEYLDSLRVAEEAALHDRHAAEMLERGEEMPERTPAQKRVVEMGYVMYPQSVNEELLIVLSDSEGENLQKNEDDTSLGKQKAHQRVGPSLDDFPIISQDLEQLASIFAEMYIVDESACASSTSSSVPEQIMVQCTVCADELRFDKALHTECDHYYCPECIELFVESAARDEEIYPIRCCLQPIPISSLNKFISPALRIIFAQKTAEYAVCAQSRVFCSNKECLIFLGTSEGIETHVMPCPLCDSLTCSMCKEAEHAEECVDVAAEQVRVLAQTERWQTCPGCNYLVERTGGCLHMVCRCGVQFCYICAAIWKACECR